MLAIRALLVDFDGAACLQDVSGMLLDAFGQAGWERFDDVRNALEGLHAVDGPIGCRRCPAWRTV